MKARITISLKQGILDPQGKAIMQALHGLGYDDVQDARVGKSITLTLEGTASKADAEVRLRGMCQSLLANPVMESFEIEWV